MGRVGDPGLGGSKGSKGERGGEGEQGSPGQKGDRVRKCLLVITITTRRIITRILVMI